MRTEWSQYASRESIDMVEPDFGTNTLLGGGKGADAAAAGTDVPAAAGAAAAGTDVGSGDAAACVAVTIECTQHQRRSTQT